MKTIVWAAMVSLSAGCASTSVRAAPVLEITTPPPVTFAFGTDYLFATNSPAANLTGAFAFNAANPFGCSGDTASTVIVVQRGSCEFDTKIAAAASAGAQAIIIFNSGIGAQTGVFQGLTTAPSIPVVFASYAAGQVLASRTGQIHIESDAAAVPEPSPAAVLGVGLLAAGLARRRVGPG